MALGLRGALVTLLATVDGSAVLRFAYAPVLRFFTIILRWCGEGHPVGWLVILKKNIFPLVAACLLLVVHVVLG